MNNITAWANIPKIRLKTITEYKKNISDYSLA